MKPKRILSFFFAALLPWVGHAAGSTESAVETIFSELRTIKSMQSGTRYTLPVGGTRTSGSKETFLRRRTASEIKESGLSCGCGDYAVLFIERIQARGFEALLVDSAQISSLSLANNFAGHAVVAIRPRDEAEASWWLVDSTARKILSREWSPTAKTFTASGHVYWIGYCGPLKRYPVATADGLKRFYADTLAGVPVDVFNRTLPRFVFTIDASLADEKGGYLNPRVARLGRLQEEIFAKYRIRPEREIAILLTRGGDDSSGRLEHIDGRWVARIGLKSACSPSLLSYFEQMIRLGPRN